jgi:2-dehydro-3-deoxyphosphogluconate aldolase/(4S)-4-hydroxy-2-oxoglutarate aldolase
MADQTRDPASTSTTERALLGQPSVLAIGGSWIAPSGLIEAGRFDEITRLAREAATLAGTR